MAKDKKKKSVTKHIVGKIFVLVLLLAASIGTVSVIQTRDIERGILEVCATQQDGYVKLVLDQINLKDNRNNEEIISEILQTMDASSNKYWVFSQDQTMLFVKDVTETNRYKGFSAESYWATEDAQEFLNSLEPDVVKHDFIQLGDVEYLASGAIFTYQGKEYRLCLLTNRAALLDNNDYLGARSRLLVIMLIALGIIIILPMSLAFVVAKERRHAAEQQNTIATLNTRLQDLSDRVMHSELYDNKRHVWSAEAFEPFVQKILDRGVTGAYLAQVVCDDAKAADDFINRASVILNNKVVRFSMTPEIVVLLFPATEPEDIARALESLTNETAQLSQIVPVNPAAESE